MPTLDVTLTSEEIAILRPLLEQAIYMAKKFSWGRRVYKLQTLLNKLDISKIENSSLEMPTKLFTKEPENES